MTVPASEKFWLTQLTSTERTTLIGTFAGWMLDGLDVMVYSFVLPSLILLWHITNTQAGLLQTSTLVLSSVGGWVAGLTADRFGRVRILQLTILWFAFFTFLSGFANGFHQLLVIRGLQGLGFGGEWAVGSVLIGETIRAKYRGRAVGTVQSGWAIGWAMAAGFFTLFSTMLSQDKAWRAMFWIGLAPAALAIYVRKHVQESATYTNSKAASGFAFLKIFSPSMLRITLLASLVALGGQGGYYAINTWLPLYLKSRGLSVIHTSGYLLVVIAGSFTGYLISAHLADKLGRRLTLILFAAGSAITVLLYSVVPIGDTSTLLLGFPLGAFPSGSFSPMGSFFSELFPTDMRGSGQGFAYNLGRGVGSIAPAMVGYVSAYINLGLAMAIGAASAYLLMVLAVLLLPETRGADLDRIPTNPGAPPSAARVGYRLRKQTTVSPCYLCGRARNFL
jgi:MFS family permease